MERVSSIRSIWECAAKVIATRWTLVCAASVGAIRSIMLHAARPVLAVVLLFAFLSSSVPLIVSASASKCELACCAARAPHAAGSCADGSCHADSLKRRKSRLIRSNQTEQRSKQTEQRSKQTEQLCGVPRHLEIKTLARIRPQTDSQTASDHSQTASDHKRLSKLSLSRPCPPECGASGASSTNSNRQRNSATLAQIDNRPPPADMRLVDLAHRSSQILDALCRQCAPRGPPVSFS